MELENGVQAGAGPAVTDEGAVVVGRGEAVASGRGSFVPSGGASGGGVSGGAVAVGREGAPSHARTASSAGVSSRGGAVTSGRGDATVAAAHGGSVTSAGVSPRGGAVASAHGGAVTPSGAPAGAVPEAEQVSDGMLRAAMARAVKAALASGRDEARRQSDAARAREDEQARRDMEAAFPAVLERVSAIVGKDFERGAFRDRMYAWLRAQGVPDEAVAGIRHGWELEIAAKAMLYDGMADARRRAAAKVADAPAVLAPRGRSEQDGADRLRRARAALNKHPNSTEALAELFAAL